MSDGPIDTVTFEAFRRTVQNAVPDEVESLLTFVFLKDGQVGLMVYGDVTSGPMLNLDLNAIRDHFCLGERKPN